MRDNDAQSDNFPSTSPFPENGVKNEREVIARAIFVKRTYRGLRADKQQYALIEHIYKKK